jgi:hypothetical protein
MTALHSAHWRRSASLKKRPTRQSRTRQFLWRDRHGCRRLQRVQFAELAHSRPAVDRGRRAAQHGQCAILDRQRRRTQRRVPHRCAWARIGPASDQPHTASARAAHSVSRSADCSCDPMTTRCGPAPQAAVSLRAVACAWRAAGPWREPHRSIEGEGVLAHVSRAPAGVAHVDGIAEDGRERLQRSRSDIQWQRGFSGAPY